MTVRIPIPSEVRASLPEVGFPATPNDAYLTAFALATESRNAAGEVKVLTCPFDHPGAVAELDPRTRTAIEMAGWRLDRTEGVGTRDNAGYDVWVAAK